MAITSVLPPVRVSLSCLVIWILLFSVYCFHVFLMASVYVSVLVFILFGIGIYHVVLPTVDEELARNVIFGNSSSLSPVFAHRGGSHDAPENTVAAMKQAKKNEAHGVEFDLSFTKDNIAVLFHDNTLDRTTSGFGKLSDSTFEEIRKLDASAQHAYHDRFKGEKVPTVEEAVETCLELDLHIIFDVKEYDDRAVSLVEHLFKKYPHLYDKCLVASFYPNFIYGLRRVDPKIVTALTWRPNVVSYDQITDGRPRYKSTLRFLLAVATDYILEWSIHNWLWYVTGVSAVLIHKDCLSPHYVRGWKERGVHVLAWTVNHSVEKECMTKWLQLPYITDTLV